MRKGIGVKIIQAPVEINFTCAHCKGEKEIDFDEFGYDLGEIFYDGVHFNCPSCGGKLYVGEAELD